MGSATTLSPARFPLWLGGACLLLLALVVVGFAAGKFPVAPGDVLAALWASLSGSESGLAANVQAVITQVRAPRVAAALAVGAALSAAGASYQGLFRNPLVSPDILGVSAGCALGAAVGILAGLHAAAVQLLAFGGGMAAVGCVVGVAAAVRGRDALLTLILSGIVVGSLFGAGVALAKYLADPFNALPSITFWLLGSFAGVMPGDLGMACALIVAGLVPLALLRWRVDVLALSDDEARSLGLRVGVLRLAVIAAATLVTAAAVSIAGTIGWIGLVIPHAARLAAGAAFARVLPLSIVMGAAFMLAVDTLCRTLFAEEIPPGVVMAFVGTPAFVALMAAAFRGRTLGEGFEAGIRAGEVACLIGPNGSGKTTLLRTLLGVLPRLAGSIVLDGRDIASYAPRERATRIAYVPQASASDFDFSVEEIVEMGRTAHRGAFGRPGERDRRICAEALERLGIAHLASRPIGRVSGGERQLTLVARALATKARVLLMDEPTASLDFANQARVLDEVARLRDAGAAILFTTHHPDQALRIADHALLLREGRLVAAGPTASAVNSQNLSALYGQPIDVIEVASGDERPCRVCVSRSGARFD